MSRDVPTTAILPVHHPEAVIDALAAAGLTPADDSPIRWVADRWYAVAEAGDLLVLADHDVDNERVRWAVTDRFGVIYAEGEFPVNEIGLAMLTAALLAAANEGVLR